VVQRLFLPQDNILKVEVVDFKELGMEAVRKITVKTSLLLLQMIKENDFFEKNLYKDAKL
jgi:fumarate hydratase class I